jgi:L-alanine-DL-glutamate epimerase-like enolase superfamily enzyme
VAPSTPTGEPLYIEQPCASYHECPVVCRKIHRPFIFDEVIHIVAMLVEGVRDQAMDIVNLKISKVDGLAGDPDLIDQKMRTRMPVLKP